MANSQPITNQNTALPKGLMSQSSFFIQQQCVAMYFLTIGTRYLIIFTNSMYTLDSALILSCLEGDNSSWVKLVERYGILVYNIALYHKLTKEDADLVFENVFNICFQKLDKLGKNNSITRWMITTAYDQSAQLSRKKNPEFGKGEYNQHIPSGELIQKWEHQHMIREALRTLDSSCRELLTIYFLEDPKPTTHQIARRLGVAVDNLSPLQGDCFEKLETVLHDMGLVESTLMYF